MKTLVCKLAVSTLVAAALSVGVAKAQITHDIHFTAPSSFVAGEATLPAGKYVIRLVSVTGDKGALEIASTSGSHSVIVDVESSSSETPAKSTGVIFSKYGNSLVLSEIVLANQKTGYSISSKHAEKRVAKGQTPTKQPVAAEEK